MLKDILGKRDPSTDALFVSEQIKEDILDKVARKAWENELVNRFQTQYIIKHVDQQSRDIIK